VSKYGNIVFSISPKLSKNIENIFLLPAESSWSLGGRKIVLLLSAHSTGTNLPGQVQRHFKCDKQFSRTDVDPDDKKFL